MIGNVEETRDAYRDQTISRRVLLRNTLLARILIDSWISSTVLNSSLIMSENQVSRVHQTSPLAKNQIVYLQ